MTDKRDEIIKQTLEKVEEMCRDKNLTIVTIIMQEEDEEHTYVMLGYGIAPMRFFKAMNAAAEQMRDGLEKMRRDRDKN